MILCSGDADLSAKDENFTDGIAAFTARIAAARSRIAMLEDKIDIRMLAERLTAAPIQWAYRFII